MSRNVGTTLPDELWPLVDGEALETKVGAVIQLLTVSETGWPHTALLSAGEVLGAEDRQRLGLALWAGTETTSNLHRTGRCSTTFVHGGSAFYLDLSVDSAGSLDLGALSLDCFVATIERALVDEVDYATLTSGITFEFTGVDGVLERWSITIEALRSLLDTSIASP